MLKNHRSIRENTVNLIIVSSLLFFGVGCLCLGGGGGDRRRGGYDSPAPNGNQRGSKKPNTKSDTAKKATTPDNGDFLVEYVDVQDSRYEKVNEEMRDEKVLETASRDLNKNLALPYDITLRTTDCGQINAFYSDKDHSITVCYELMDFYYKLFKKANYSDDEAGQKMMDTMQFIFLHELGHGLIKAYDLPVTGNEEDAADKLSSYINLNEMGDSGSRAAFAAAQAFDLQAQLQEGQQLPFYDEHSLDQQRFYNILCQLYGSNPTKYEVLVTKNLLPQQRAARCPAEFQQNSRTWQTLLKNYRKQ